MTALVARPAFSQLARNAAQNATGLEDSGRTHNAGVLLSLLGPMYRGLVLQKGRREAVTSLPTGYDVAFNWGYARDHVELGKLTRAARRGQWDPDTDLDWSTTVDLHDERRPFYKDRSSPLWDVPGFDRLDAHKQREMQRDIVSWMLCQSLHGEQGALFVACQLTEAVPWMDGKLYGSTQVMDEGRHVEVFQRYIHEKLEKSYTVDDNLYVVLDALMSDRRWDFKFLGMQILIEGLALGAFSALRQATGEPLLAELLKYVITDEARHVHFGVLALQEAIAAMPERDRRDREDWAYEICVLMRNRFLGHEIYEEHWAHAMSRREWDKVMQDSAYMRKFRENMFKRTIPNLKRIGLLSDRVRGYYESLGLLAWENERAAPELTAADLVG